MDDKIIELLNIIRPEFDFAEENNFIESGLLDSFDLVSLVTELDSVFKISIDGADILPENFATLEYIINLLKKYGAK